MRWLIPFTFGGLTAGTAFFGWLLFREPPEPEPLSVTTIEYLRACDERDDERERRRWADRRAVLWETWATIYRDRLHQLGQPQSWPGPTVSTILVRPQPADRENPETIPPPAVPFPTRGND